MWIAKAVLWWFSLFATLNVVNSSPVLIWGGNGARKYVPKTVNELEFAEMLLMLLEDHMVVIFMEPNLTIKDFECANAEGNKSCFEYLSTVNDTTFYANVYDPFSALRLIPVTKKAYSLNQYGQLETLIKCDVGSLTTINLNDGGFERAQQLTAHDSLMRDVVNSLSCPVVYIYMEASFQPDVSNSFKNGKKVYYHGFFFHKETFAIYIGSVVIKKRNHMQLLELDHMYIHHFDVLLFQVNITTKSKNSILFDVELVGESYVINTIKFDGLDHYVENVDMPQEFSYACRVLIAQTNGSLLIFEEVQFQAGVADPATYQLVYQQQFAFAEPWYCDGFITPPIAMAYLLMFGLLIPMMTWAILMLMNISRQNRFDVPEIDSTDSTDLIAPTPLNVINE